MPKFHFNKLVRDKIPEQMVAAGDTPHGKTLDPEQTITELVRKLAEETSELQTASSQEVTNELADIQEIVDAIRDNLGITPDQLKDAQDHKRQLRGGYQLRKYISWVQVNKDSVWLKYLRQSPKKYPEE